MQEEKLAIEVDNVQKIYKLYDKPLRSDEGGFRLRKKTKHKLHTMPLKGVDMKIYQEKRWVLSVPTVPVNPRS